MTERRVRRVVKLLVSLTALWALIAVGSAQAATVTVGSPLTASFNSFFSGTTTELNSALPEPGAKVTSPVNGTVVSWRVDVKAVGGFALRVIRQGSASTYLGAGTSPATANATGIQTFPASLPVKTGDLIGLDLDSIAEVLEAGPIQGAVVRQWAPLLPDGSSLTPGFTFTNTELAYNADVRYCLVPRLKGKKLGPAKRALGAAGCTAGKVNKPKKKGKLFVRSQSVTPGTALADGAAVGLKLGKKPKKKKS